MTWWLENAGNLNIGVSLLVLGVGFLIFWFFRPAVFAQYPYTRAAFVYWLLQWILFVFLWLFFEER